MMWLATTHVAAQATPAVVVHGRVVHAQGGAPVRAHVSSARAGIRATTDATGAFSLALPHFPDTIVVRAIGFAPRSVVLESPPGGQLLIAVTPVAVQLGDLVSRADLGSQLATGIGGTWVVDGKATSSLPTAVEPDINRSLALIPAVSFTSLLSSRPMLRGIDSDDAGYAIDGFDAINLYHVGRFFSAIPAVAVDRAEVQLQPIGAGIGGTTSGRVNIVGKRGEGVPAGEIGYGLGAWSGAFGAGGALPYFVAGRTAKLTFVDALQSEAQSLYDFHDLYAHATPTIAGLPAELTVFSASDRVVGEQDVGRNTDNPSMRWTNLVLGGRSTILQSGRGSVTVSASLARHTEESQRVPARDTKLDVRNRFTRGSLGVIGTTEVSGATSLRFGGNLDTRSIVNHLNPSGGSEGPVVDVTTRLIEGATYAELEHRLSKVTIIGGGRVTSNRAMQTFEPRFQIRWTPTSSNWFAVGVGETTRSYHLLSDARSEPKLAYYDIWLSAGENGIAIPRTRHIAAEFGHAYRGGDLRIGLFAARGSGAMDLVSGSSFGTGDSLFRIGNTRVAGMDMNVSAGDPGGAWSVRASYALTFSERNWGSGWTPWVNGRRHQARLFGTLRGGPGVRFSATTEWTSGAPYTPITGWQDSGDPGRPTPVYGLENSATGGSLLRADLSIVKEFSGPWGSLIEAGASVTNLSIGDQSPRRQDLVTRFSGGVYTTTVRTKLLFDLPPVPSLNLRIRFGGTNRR